MIDKSEFMQIALEEARKAGERGEVPVGAVIVDADKNIIAQAGNRTEELSDPTAHAEILAIKEACEKLGSPRLIGCSLYVTLEPCPMCAAAISFARITALYYAASDPKSGGVDNGAKIFNASSCHHKPDIYDSICAGEASDLLKDFFKERR